MIKRRYAMTAMTFATALFLASPLAQAKDAHSHLEREISAPSRGKIEGAPRPPSVSVADPVSPDQSPRVDRSVDSWLRDFAGYVTGTRGVLQIATEAVAVRFAKALVPGCGMDGASDAELDQAQDVDGRAGQAR